MTMTLSRKAEERGAVTTRFSLSVENERLTWDGTAEPVSRDQIFRRERGQGKNNALCSVDHEQDWQPYPVDPCSGICHDHTHYQEEESHDVE